LYFSEFAQKGETRPEGFVKEYLEKKIDGRVSDFI